MIFGARALAPRADRADLAAAIERVTAERSAPSATPRRAARRFDGAVVDRLTAQWLATGTSIDQELRGQLDRLRARSRDLAKNNEYVAKYLRMVLTNVVGPEGFTLQSRVYDPNGQPDSLANRAVEDGWWRWMRPGNCEVTGRQSFVDVCRTVMTAVARDGEVLIRRARGRGFGEFGYQLQVVDIDRLDTNYNVPAAGGRNAIIMGVEIDTYGRPVAYHVFEAHPHGPQGGGRVRQRWDAAEVFHLFVPFEPEQNRGVPWLHAAMRRLNDLNGYREAAVIAARIGACKAGFYQQLPGAEPAPPIGDEDPSDPGSFSTEVSPGQFDVVPLGYELKEYDPTYPHEQFGAFCTAALRGISSALPGGTYHGIGNDLTGVSYSSIRSGVIESRDEWMVLQNWLIAVFLTPVFEEWVDVALLGGRLKLPNGSALPAAKADKFRAHVWQPRRWQWVDPLKDIEAGIRAINNGLASPQQIAAQSGRDVEDIIEDMAQFQALAKSKDLEYPLGINRPLAKPGKAAAPDEAEEDADKATAD
jgi:lambda family phage portal protein